MLCRLIDEWSRIDGNNTAVVNATLCSSFPTDYCPDGERQGCSAAHDLLGQRDPSAGTACSAGCCRRAPGAHPLPRPCVAPAPPAVDARSKYGVSAEAQGACKLNSWLLPDACLLPVPFPVAVQLGEWERQSRNLTASAQAQQAFEGGGKGRDEPGE